MELIDRRSRRDRSHMPRYTPHTTTRMKTTTDGTLRALLIRLVTVASGRYAMVDAPGSGGHPVAGERRVDPAAVAGDVPTEPVGHDEGAGGLLRVELHLDGAQPGQGPTVPIDLGHASGDGHPVAHLLDAPALGVGPQRLGLFGIERHLDLGA